MREDLARKVHEFGSKGDTEVLVHLAEHLPAIEVARRVDGMFAFAVWDDRRGRLVLGRDRVGKKPLFCWGGARRLVFGSEVKTLFADPQVPRRLHRGAIPAYLTFGHVPRPRTYARLVATRHRTDHHEFVVRPEAVDLVERLVWHHDQPFGDSSAIPTYLVSEATARHVSPRGSPHDGIRRSPPRCREQWKDWSVCFRGGSFRGRALKAQRFARVAARGLPDAYRCWISFVSEGDRETLLDGRRDDRGLDDYRET
jgi:asparagine synthetase B (glutamine-hydrolysing)